MKLATAALVLTAVISSSSAFAPASKAFVRPSSAVYGTEGLDLSGNNWKPDSEKMGSTDTGDYFPEGYAGAEVGKSWVRVYNA
jgi:hypothetical protein